MTPFYMTEGTTPSGEIVRPWECFNNPNKEPFSIHGEGAALRVVGILCEYVHGDLPKFANINRNGSIYWARGAELLTEAGRAEVTKILRKYGAIEKADFVKMLEDIAEEKRRENAKKGFYGVLDFRGYYHTDNGRHENLESGTSREELETLYDEITADRSFVNITELDAELFYNDTEQNTAFSEDCGLYYEVGKGVKIY